MSTHRQNRSNTKDDWRTPMTLFRRLDGRFRFTGDACASDLNALCDNFFTEKTDALNSHWGGLGSRVFMNPPYSRCYEFMARAWRAVRVCGREGRAAAVRGQKSGAWGSTAPPRQNE